MHYIRFNLNLINQYIPISDYVFKYEDYCEQYIMKLSKFLKINLNKLQIKTIMKELDDMHHLRGKYATMKYSTILYTKEQNTSSGKNGEYKKFFTKQEQTEILNDKKIRKFLKDNKYIQ